MSESPNAPFDPIAAIAAEPVTHVGPGSARLSRTEQCQAFAVLKSGRFAHSIVAKMFGLSLPSVSFLANCAERKPGRLWRYPQVAAEWRRLGEDEFMKAYMTEEMWLKAKRLKYDRIIAAGPLDNRLRGPRPTASHYAYDRYGDFAIVPAFGRPCRARVDWIESDPTWIGEHRGPIGWRYGIIEPDGTIYYSGRPQSQVKGNVDLPFATSGEAFDAAHDVFDLPSPRRKRS